MSSSSKEDAIALKEKGNAAFKQHDWPTAVDYYTKAIEAYDKEPSFYTNRAQVAPTWPNFAATISTTNTRS
jgi:serine/threonine-protein phosphatase 5